MKKSIYLVFLLVIIFSISLDLIPLMKKTIIVEYQRVTGPELIVLNGKENLKSQCFPTDKSTNFSEVYINTDIENVFFKSYWRKFIISGKVVNKENMTCEGDYLTVIVRHYMSLFEFSLRIGVIIILLLLLPIVKMK